MIPWRFCFQHQWGQLNQHACAQLLRVQTLWLSIYISTTMVYPILPVQAALVIRGIAIRSFDYLRVRKQGKTANSSICAKFWLKLTVLVIAGLNF
jgi:hypothetical protein